jgi:hypothetical protein
MLLIYIVINLQINVTIQSDSVNTLSFIDVSFMGLASYLFYLGIYSASVSMSEDSKLRQSIRRAAIKESTEFLDSIGTAEMEHEIERRVVLMTSTTKENIEKETGISSSFDDEDLRKYLHGVL